MFKFSGHYTFGNETLQCHPRRNIGFNDFDSDLAAAIIVHSEKDFTHAAPCESSDDTIFVIWDFADIKRIQRQVGIWP
jgi:hypothetical protein